MQDRQATTFPYIHLPLKKRTSRREKERDKPPQPGVVYGVHVLRERLLATVACNVVVGIPRIVVPPTHFSSNSARPSRSR